MQWLRLAKAPEITGSGAFRHHRRTDPKPRDEPRGPAPTDRHVTRLETLLEIEHLCHQLFVQVPVRVQFVVSGLFHQRFFGLKMPGGILGQFIQRRGQHRFTGPIAHGVVKFIDQFNQAAMLPVDGVDIKLDALVPDDQVRLDR